MTHQTTYRVDNRHGHKVIFLEVDGHLVEGHVGLHRHGVGLHHILDFGDRGVGDEFLQREGAAQSVVVVDDIDVIDLVHVLGLHPELFDALGHRPVLVDHKHLGTHQTTGGVLVIFEKVDDVARLLHVVDVGDHLVAVLLVKVLDEVNRVVGVEMVDIQTGDFLGVHVAEELPSVILVKLHQHGGGLVAIEQLVEVFGLRQVEVLIQLGDVGRVHLLQLTTGGGLVVVFNDMLYFFEKILVEFLHWE